MVKELLKIYLFQIVILVKLKIKFETIKKAEKKQVANAGLPAPLHTCYTQSIDCTIIICNFIKIVN